ncbi:uncharacterized protein PG998_004879 [Apiospora kogelbergensis]|uniref:Uncharacterized protein n=1 Tax=Apiospora kogelbergensis TaxID=1337665 RepID=A0AAW0Q7K0_9PEZI
MGANDLRRPAKFSERPFLRTSVCMQLTQLTHQPVLFTDICEAVHGPLGGRMGGQRLDGHSRRSNVSTRPLIPVNLFPTHTRTQSCPSPLFFPTTTDHPPCKPARCSFLSSSEEYAWIEPWSLAELGVVALPLADTRQPGRVSMQAKLISRGSGLYVDPV